MLLACVFEDFIKVSISEFDINPLFCVSLPGYTLKYTDMKLKTLQEKDLLFLLESNIRGIRNSVMRDRYVESDENKKIIYMEDTNLYGHSISQVLPYGEIEMWHGHPDIYLN